MGDYNQSLHSDRKVEGADARQVGGGHYKVPNPQIEHWNLVIAYNWDYFTAQVIKYMMRWPEKGGIQDLEKAAHFLQKLIETKRLDAAGKQQRLGDDPSEPGRNYVRQ